MSDLSYLATSTAVLTMGRQTFVPGWRQFVAPSVKDDPDPLLEKADKLIQSADTKEKVSEVVNLFESALEKDPRNRKALEGAGFYTFLIAYGYPGSKEDKKDCLLNAIKYSEQKMYTNPNFAARVDSGENAWDACDALSENEFKAIVDWTLAMGIFWREHLNGLQKLININYTLKYKKMLAAMMKINPQWGSGTPYYMWANFYASVPGFLGGDMKKAEQYYQKAIENGPDMLSFRRTRALFFHTKTGNRKAFEDDLNWVLDQDPHIVRHYLTYPWNAFLRQNAMDLLNQADDYFGRG